MYYHGLRLNDLYLGDIVSLFYIAEEYNRARGFFLRRQYLKLMYWILVDHNSISWLWHLIPWHVHFRDIKPIMEMKKVFDEGAISTDDPTASVRKLSNLLAVKLRKTHREIESGVKIDEAQELCIKIFIDEIINNYDRISAYHNPQGFQKALKRSKMQLEDSLAKFVPENNNDLIEAQELNKNVGTRLISMDELRRAKNARS